MTESPMIGLPDSDPIDWDQIAETTSETIVPQLLEDSSGESGSAMPVDSPESPAPNSAADRVRNFVKGGGKKKDGTSKPDRSSRPIPPKPREGSLVKPLEQLYCTMGLVIAPLDPVCSTAILTNAHNCAVSLEALARENEAVRRVILALVQTSAWGGVIAAHLPVIAMIMTHHGPESIRERAAGMAMVTNPDAFQRLMQEAEDAKAEGVNPE